MRKYDRDKSVPEIGADAQEKSAVDKKNNRAAKSGRRPLPGPHQKPGPGNGMPSHSSDDPPWDDPPSPNHDTIGGGNAEPPFTGWRFQSVEPAGEPGDYFYRLCLDQLQVAVYGIWKQPDNALRLSNLRKQSEANKKSKHHRPVYYGPDGVGMDVYPHGARPGYSFLMKGKEAPEVRGQPTNPNTDAPSFMIRFGARWCVERGLAYTRSWIEELMLALGFEIDRIALSEVHIRCDIPTPFHLADLAKLRGTGTRLGDYNTRHHAGALVTIDNLGGDKSIHYSIYDKRVEQEKTQGVFWPAVWKAYGIPESTPIWRVEGRWKRKRLLHRGLDNLADLTERSMRMLWAQFTNKYLRFVDDAAKRSSRTEDDARWKPVSECGDLYATTPIKYSVLFDHSHLWKQARGTLVKMLEMADAQLDEATARMLADEVFSEFGDRLENGESVSRLEIEESVVRLYKRHPNQHLISNAGLVNQIVTQVAELTALRRSRSRNSNNPNK